MIDESTNIEAQPPTVFIVDDDPSLCSALILLLECEGLVAKAFPNAEAFLEAYDPDQVGCLVLDIDIPGLDGLRLQQELAEGGFDIPIIFLTGQANVPQTVQAFKTGAVDLLQKPASEAVLLERIGQAIDQHRLVRRVRARRSEVMARMARLTEREHQIMELVIAGASNKEIAGALEISHRTVEVHRRHMFEKMQAGSLVELIAQARLCNMLGEWGIPPPK